MENIKKGITASKSFGTLLTEHSNAFRDLLSKSTREEIVDKGHLISYLKTIRKMRPYDSDLLFIDNL